MNQILAFLIFLPVLFSTPSISFTNHTFAIANQNGDPNYISSAHNTVTRYSLAKSNAYLAHYAYAGQHFLELSVGAIIVSGEQYTVKRIDRYTVSGSNYINQATGQVYSEGAVWNMYYLDPRLLILQTCITVNGDPVGGRLFVVGEGL
ncbi:exported hypothetical protein [Gammaproteobacteria bacterium]